MVPESEYDVLISELTEKYAVLNKFEYAKFLRSQISGYNALLKNTEFTIKVKAFDFEETAKRIIKDRKIDENAMYINALDWEIDKYTYNEHNYIYCLKKIAEQNAEENKFAVGEKKRKADEYNQFLMWRIDKCTAFLKEQAERFAEIHSRGFVVFLKMQADKYAENNNQDYAEFIRKYADGYTELIKQRDKDRAEEQRYCKEYSEILKAKWEERAEIEKQHEEFSKKLEETPKKFKKYYSKIKKERIEEEESKRRAEEEKLREKEAKRKHLYALDEAFEWRRKNGYTPSWDDDYDAGQSGSQNNADQQSSWYYNDYETRKNEQMRYYEEEKHRQELQDQRDRDWNNVINSGYNNGYNNGGYGGYGY